MPKHLSPTGGHRLQVAALAAMPPVTVADTELSGAYLATLVAIDPAFPVDESARTPQLIAELGRFTAIAKRALDDTELAYRIWRENMALDLTTDAEVAENAGLTDGRKPASRTVADAYVKTLPEYAEHYRLQHDAQEAWGTVHAAYEAAQSRSRVIFDFQRSGGGPPTERQLPGGDVDESTVRHPGWVDPPADPVDVEEVAASGSRTPIPTSKTVTPPPPRKP